MRSFDIIRLVDGAVISLRFLSLAACRERAKLELHFVVAQLPDHLATPAVDTVIRRGGSGQSIGGRDALVAFSTFL